MRLRAGAAARQHLQRAAAHALTIAALASAGWFVVYPPYWPPVRSDGYGYHLWLRAVARGSLDFCRERVHEKSYAHVRHAVRPPGPKSRRCGNIYPPGVALAKAPFVLWAVHRKPGSDPSDYEQAVTTALPVVLLAVTVELLLAILRRVQVGFAASFVAVALAGLGTGYYHYSTFDASLSHAYSAFWATLAVFAATRGGAGGVLLGALSGAMLVLTRNTNLLLVPLITALATWLRTEATHPPEHRRWQAAFRGAVPALAALVAGSAIAFSLQLGLNAWWHGGLSLSSYGATGSFAFDLSHVPDIIVSYERGLVSYYPGFAVMLVTMWAVRSLRPLALVVTGTVLAHAVVYSCWSFWHLGGGFGHRGFVEMVPLVAIGFAAAAERCRRPGVIAMAAAVAIVLTMSLMIAYWRTVIPFSGTSGAQYWAAIQTDHLSATARGTIGLVALLLVSPLLWRVYAERPTYAPPSASGSSAPVPR